MDKHVCLRYLKDPVERFHGFCFLLVRSGIIQTESCDLYDYEVVLALLVCLILKDFVGLD